MSVSQAETIRTLSDTVTRLERENEVLQRFNNALLQQVQDLQFQLNSERALFDHLTLLEPPRGDGDTTEFDLKPVQ